MRNLAFGIALIAAILSSITISIGNIDRANNFLLWGIWCLIIYYGTKENK